jgi:hypothetical protein
MIHKYLDLEKVSDHSQKSNLRKFQLKQLKEPTPQIIFPPPIAEQKVEFQLWKNCERNEGLRQISTPFMLKVPEKK